MDGKSVDGHRAELKMSYTIPHFMGYRFGLFNYATKARGGYADFDFFPHHRPDSPGQLNASAGLDSKMVSSVWINLSSPQTQHNE
jgi:hypothetical protein